MRTVAVKVLIWLFASLLDACGLVFVEAFCFSWTQEWGWWHNR